MMEELINKAADIICKSELTLALTGAGISVESGIPDFRGAGGLWSKYDPSEYATISAFMSDPEKVWNMLRDMEELVSHAKPNRAHTGMGELEEMGLLHFIITQNVDNLHQEGGAKNIIEYHGNSSTLSCQDCNRKYSSSEKKEEYLPRCDCNNILKPDVIFFGEAIPQDVLYRTFRLAESAQALMVVGTSAVVSPANSIPDIAKQNGAKIIEVNKERTHLTESVTDIFIRGEAGKIMDRLVTSVKKYRVNPRL
ncbi:NAD-dependent deacylase [Deltaproteobacteria bacterium]|nr:NAD-dependent deacylase [Deltaproteobacteria bacterium]